MASAVRWPTGLIVGRFDPPHLGHSHMIEQALARVGTLVVYVNSRVSDAVPGDRRAGWLAELHPAARVVEVRHDLDTDFADEQLWQRWIALFRERWPLETGPDVVLSSDAYVEELARRLGAESDIVDPQRRAVPVSATLIRGDPGGHLDRLAPPVRAWVEANWC